MINLNHGSGSLTGEKTVDLTVSEYVNVYINAALERRREEHKLERGSYVGMSELGEKCLRKAYYHCTDAPRAPIKGEMLRRWEMGHAFETMVLDWLIAGGFVIRTRNSDGKQFELSAVNGRMKGHPDGVIVGGPSIPYLVYPALSEIKALELKAWNAIVKHGLEKAEPKYYGQVQVYMGYGKIINTLFSTINKNTAEIYHCIIPYNGKVAQGVSDNGVSLIKMLDMGLTPSRISAKRDFYLCKMCEHGEHCWSTAT